MKIDLSEELKEMDKIIELQPYYQRKNLYSKWKQKITGEEK